MNILGKHLARRLAALAIFMAWAVAAQGQDAAIEGRVYDINEQGQPVATSATATMGAGSVSAETLRPLRALETFYKDVKTVHATFDQLRVDEAFQEEIKSPGEMWLEKPGRFRVDYQQPQLMINLVADNTLYIYLSEQQQVEFWKFESAEERDQHLQYLLIGFGFKTDELLRRNEIRSSEDDPELQAELKKAGGDQTGKVLFEVRPRPAFEESTPFKVLKVTVDKASHLPEKIWYKDLSDADMTLNMKKIELDPRLPEKVYDKDSLFPRGVQYIDKRNAQ